MATRDRLIQPCSATRTGQPESWMVDAEAVRAARDRPRNAVSPSEAGDPRSAASRWEAAANPWLRAIARRSRTGSSNPSPSSRESTPNRRSVMLANT